MDPGVSSQGVTGGNLGDSLNCSLTQGSTEVCHGAGAVIRVSPGCWLGAFLGPMPSRPFCQAARATAASSQKHEAVKRGLKGTVIS